MVLHVLKNDPALRELEHVQVDSSGMAYLFYDRHGCHSLTWEAAQSVTSHMADTFLEWIGQSTHFEVVPLLLDEGCHHTGDPSNPLVHASVAASSGSSLQLVGGVISTKYWGAGTYVVRGL